MRQKWRDAYGLGASLCSGFVFAACSENKDFEVNKIEVVQDEFTYDGNAHAITFKYPEAKLNVAYALESDKDNFKSLEELGIKNAGTYNVYYKLSAEGYNDYKSTQTIEFTIVPKDVTITVEDVYKYKFESL